MSTKVTVYEKPTCTKCRQTNKLLNEKGIDYEKVNYFETPISETKLKSLVKKLGISANELLRSSEKKYRELKLSKADLSEKELIGLMVEYPELMQRPIVEKGTKAVLGRPPENVNELVD